MTNKEMEQQQQFFSEKFDGVHKDIRSVGDKVDRVEGAISEIKIRLAVSDEKSNQLNEKLVEHNTALSNRILECERHQAITDTVVSSLNNSLSYYKGAIAVLYILASGALIYAFKKLFG